MAATTNGRGFRMDLGDLEGPLLEAANALDLNLTGFVRGILRATLRNGSSTRLALEGILPHEQRRRPTRDAVHWARGEDHEIEGIGGRQRPSTWTSGEWRLVPARRFQGQQIIWRLEGPETAEFVGKRSEAQMQAALIIRRWRAMEAATAPEPPGGPVEDGRGPSGGPSVAP